jgi:hypothetical protein
MAATRDDPRGHAVSPLTIGAPALRRLDGHTLVAATIETGDHAYPARYQAATGPVASGAEPFLAAALPVAMRLGRPLRVDGPVSAQLLASLPSIQAIYHAWNPDWRVVPVSAAPAQPVAPHQGGVACFFSGGVDSFYTLLKHLDEIDTLIFIHGFDIPLHNAAFRARVAAAVRDVARALAKPLLEVETNLKDLIIRYAPWEYAHGALLAGVALLLSPQFARLYIAASDSYDMAATTPWGSHPLLDPLWSTERTTIVHDGCEARRIDKVPSIVRSDVALRWLRVCWENPNGEYNCGRCGKCLRTMVSLRIAGALDRCRTFDRPLDLAVLARTRLFSNQSYMLNYMEAAKRAGDWELLRALRDNSGRYRRGLRPLAGRLRRWATRSASRATGFIKRYAPPAPAPRR